MKALWFAGLLACIGTPVLAQDDEASQKAAVEAFIAGLDFKNGAVTVDGANATLKLDEGFRYLGAADAQKVLEQLWGNPPDDSVLGLVVPKAGLIDDHAWAVVLTYADEGHVSDEDASKTDYAELLAEMQEGTREANAAREEAGYGTVELLGWATAPRYDATTRKLYWAKRLKFSESEVETLNYDVRVLGRSGYLSMNAIADAGDFTTVEAGMQRVLAMTEFNEGSRYADFNSSTDKMASYGIAALIGGVAASKMGLFAKLGALLIAGKKLIIPIVIGIGALLTRVFRRKAPEQS